MKAKSFNLNLRRANPVEISRLMPFVVKSAGLEEEIFFEQIKRNWNEAVGETAARNLRPVKFEKGNLAVAVTTSSWITQSRFLKPSIISKINKVNSPEKDMVTDISFVLDSSKGKTEARNKI